MRAERSLVTTRNTVDREINKDTEMHPLVRWQFRGGIAEGDHLLHGGAGVVGLRAQPHGRAEDFAERCATHPFDAEAVDLRVDLARLVDAGSAYLSDEGERVLRQRLADDRALQLATPHLFAPVYSDGWAPPVLELRVRQPTLPCAAVRLHGRHAHPRAGRLRLEVHAPDGDTLRLEVARNGPFELTLPLADRRSDARLLLRISSEGGFVPAECEPGSSDTRELAYLIETIELLPAV